MWLDFGLAERGFWGLVGGQGGRKKKEKKQRKRTSFIVLYPNKSCFVTILEIMLPLFAKSLQTVCKTQL